MTRRIHHILCIAGVTWVLSVMGSAAFAQPPYPYAVDTRPSRGIMPNSEQLSSPLDSIDPISGKLHIQIPLASLPVGNAGSGFDLALTYDSHLFDLYGGEVADGRISQYISNALNGGGWHYNFANYRVELETRYIPTWEQPTCDGDLQYVTEHERVYRYRISLPDGSQHILHLLGYGDEKGDTYYGDGFYAITMDGLRSACAQGNHGRYPSNATGLLTYFTTDGSYLRFQITADGTNPATKPWTLFYPDGRRVEGRGDRAEHIYDANGNGTHIANQIESGHVVTYITDDFARSIRLEFSLTASPTEREDKITAVGPGGVLEWRVKWQRLQVGGAGFTYICYQDDPGHPMYTVVCPVNFQFWVVKYIQLPLAAPNFTPPPVDPWKSFEFTYSSTGQGYGRLLTMRVPSGTQYAYCCDVYSSSFYAQDVAYAGYSTRTLTHDGAVDIWSYQAIDRTSVRVTGPDGGQTIYHFYDPLIASEFWSRNLVYWIEEPGGIVRKRQWTRNRVFSLAAAINVDPNNPYVERESVTVDKVIGQLRTTVIDTLIDKNGNTLQTKEYGWSSALTGQTMESPGALERTTDKTYHVSVPASTNTTNGSNRYWHASAPRRVDAVARQIVRDSASAVKAISEFDYDDPLTKGNLQYQRHWDDAKPGCSASTPLSSICPAKHREYDTSGNLIDVFEPEIRTHITYTGPYPSLVEYAPGTALLRSFTYEWNQAAGALLTQTDIQSGTVAGYSYDAYGRQSLVDAGGLRLSQTIYDDENRTVLIKEDLRTYGDGVLQTSTHRDQLGRIDLVRTSDGAPLSPSGSDGIKTRSTYRTFAGGMTVVQSKPYRSTSDATLEWICTQKDQAGRVVVIAAFKGADEPADCLSTANRTGITVTDYHSETGPPRTRAVDPAGKTVARYADALGRLVTVIEDPGGLAYTTSYQYDALSNLTGATQIEGSVTQQRDFTYTSLGRLKTTSNPESGVLAFTFNDSGDLLTREDSRGYLTGFRYDDLHRILEKTFSNDSDVTPDVTYDYHAAGPCVGQVRSVASDVGSTSYNNCDALGHLLSQTQLIVGAGSFDFNYTYWLTGGLKTMQYPSGKLVSFDVDDAARVMKIYTAERVYGDLSGPTAPYTADGRVTKLKLGNNLWESRDYQAPGIPTVLKLGISEGAADKLELQYNYAPDSNNGNLLSQVIRRGNAAWAQTYEYDGLNRLVCATETTSSAPTASCSLENSWRQTFGYDRFGNRWVSSSAGFTFSDVHETVAETTFNKANNQLNVVPYDPAGNQTLFTPWSLSYDAENRMLAATSASNGNSWFTYDGEGRRIKKVTATPDLQTTFYIYDASGKLAAEYSTQAVPPSTTYLFADHLGTPRAITDQDGNVVDCSDYSPFGRLLETPTRTLPCHQAPNHGSQQFTGTVRDRETNLDWLSSRYYSGAQGRFTSADSLVIKPSWMTEPARWNHYAYALNNPLRFVDRDGHDAIAAFFLGEEYRNVSTFEVIFSKETISDIRKGADQFFADHRAITHDWSPVPTSQSDVELQIVLPVVGKAAGPILRKIGGATVQRFIGTGVDDAPIVIGETMKRVKAAAAKIPGAKTIEMPEFKQMGLSGDELTSEMMSFNRRWIFEMMKDGRKIIDIGLDPDRKVRSIFYEMERAMLRNYKKLHPEFDNVITK